MRRLACLLLWLPLALGAVTPVFPPLTGRVVDAAGVLSAAAKQSLTETLAAHERTGGNQVVVVTLKSLQGMPIEDYGYQLGRHWGIGEKGKDNGVLLLVAPDERAVRIEVGYGLEGTLTDALTADIIQTRILPAFRAGDFDSGVGNGVAAILQALSGDYAPVPASPPATVNGGEGNMAWVFFVGLFIGQILLLFTRWRWLSGIGAAGVGLVIGMIVATFGAAFFIAVMIFIFHFLSGMSGIGRGFGGRGRFGGGFGGGGFRGGGGSFGGGGASGRW